MMRIVGRAGQADFPVSLHELLARERAETLRNRAGVRRLIAAIVALRDASATEQVSNLALEEMPLHSLEEQATDSVD